MVAVVASTLGSGLPGSQNCKMLLTGSEVASHSNAVSPG